jgi:DNA-binding winged helix-turn-helix (wHTH) protein
MRRRFGECVFDLGARRLERSGAELRLSPKAFELLALLLERAPNAVSKDELQALLWPATFVGPTSLARLVNEVRGAIGDDRHSERFVRTLRRFGYAFCAAVQEESTPGPSTRAAATACALHWGSREVPLIEGENLIGRAPDCVVRIPSFRVSRHHARIVVAKGKVVIEDLGSKNGTSVGGKTIAGTTPLADGDVIRIDREELTFLATDLAGTTHSASRG